MANVYQFLNFAIADNLSELNIEVEDLCLLNLGQKPVTATDFAIEHNGLIERQNIFRSQLKTLNIVRSNDVCPQL